jgi:CRP-like cAMP-binding protein
LSAFLLRRMDHTVAALTRCRIAIISHRSLFEIVEKYPRIRLALWANTMVDAAIYRQWLTSIGRHSAYARTAHLFAKCTRDCMQSVW